MKTNPKRYLPIFLAWCALAVAGQQTLHAAVAIQVTPAEVKSDYTGPALIRITGLSPGQKVVVEKFSDFNGNNVPDAGEPLTQSFPLTDGQRSEIGGVINPNMPGDTDGLANGSIEAAWQLATDSEINRVEGKFILRVSSPTGLFTPVTTPFTISPITASQSITGKVTGNGAALPNAFVVLLGRNGRLVNAVSSATDGSYSIKVLPGSYSINALKQGYVTHFDQSVPVTVGASQSLTANVALEPANRQVSGKLIDAATGEGIAGMQLTVGNDSENGFCLGFTDASGNFTMNVPAANDAVEVSELSLAQAGYVVKSNAGSFDTTAGNVTGLSIPAFRANALVYGTLKKQDGSPIAGVQLTARENQDLHSSTGVVLENGSYAIAALAGDLHVEVDDDDVLASLGLIPPNRQISISTGQALEVNLVAGTPAAHLRGFVRDENSNPVGGVYVYACAGQGNCVNSTTSEDGSFEMGAPAEGGVYVGISDSDARDRNFVGSSLTLQIVKGVDQSNILLKATQATQHISGTVTAGGLPVIGAFVSANISVEGNTYSSSDRTDNTGHYQLNAFNGQWIVYAEGNAFIQLGFPAQSGQIVTISGADAVANFAAEKPSPPQIQTTSLPKAFVGGFYAVSLSAAGGQPPYSWSLAPGSMSLPEGLALQAFGQISGTPTTAANTSPTFRLTDSLGTFVDKQLVLTASLPVAPRIQALSLAGGVINLRIIGEAGPRYQLQGSTDLKPGSWSTILNVISPGNTIDHAASLDGDKNYFYRVLVAQ